MYHIEKDFEHCGLRCFVLLIDHGYRCGYVMIPETHPLHGRHYNHESTRTLWAHGGITFSGNHTFADVTGWVFGFDCMHYNDAPDIDAVRSVFEAEDLQLLAEYHAIMERAFTGEIRTTEYVVEECKRLAEQLIKE